METAPTWVRHRQEARLAGVRSAWSVPFTGTSGLTGVITVLGREPGSPTRDELNLVTLYAGYAASALERDRLLGELTARNRVLETIREILETLAGPVPLAEGLDVALRALQIGLRADEVALLTTTDGEAEPTCRGCAGRGPISGQPSPELMRTAAMVLAEQPDVGVRALTSPGAPAWSLGVAFSAPGGTAALITRWPGEDAISDHTALIEDAANSLRLALEREASERVRREAMALRTSQDLQRKFLSSLSHELRTPLTAIRGYASSLLQPDVSWDGDSQRRFLDRISDESARLGRLVDDLLDFSAIDAGILRLQPDWCDLSLVLEAAKGCVPVADTGRIELHCADDLPIVWADHDRLEQVFVNLIDNAVRHNPPGTVVTVDARAASASTVRVSVVDNGLGVPPDVVAGNFATRRERRGRTAGAGLGLSIAKGIVDAHGGRPGDPEARSRDHLRGHRAGSPGRPARGCGGRCLNYERLTRVLIVEDDPNIVDLIRSNLVVRGFDTVVCTDGSRALQLLETEAPDIVLLDLMLPDADGFELCRQIRERSAVGVIVVSARGGERDKVSALNVGADDYMTKPFSIEELLARITATLRRTRVCRAGAKPRHRSCWSATSRSTWRPSR